LVTGSVTATSPLTPSEVDKREYYRTLEQVRDATVLVASKSGFGTGIVISPQGLILTNYHVIHNVKVEDIKIWLYDAEELGYYTVELLGIDPFADIAVLHINNMPELKMPMMYLELENDKNNYSLAQEVWAIGHPLGMQWSVTKGVINNYDRSSFITAYVRLIQHTALIQKGNSGGPLVNRDGKVVGVNTYVTKPKDALGFGYATRADDVFFTISQIIEYGKVFRPAMSIQSMNLNEFTFVAIQERYGADVKIPSGIYGSVVFGLIDKDTGEVKSPWAIEHGLRELDVIIAFDDAVINSNIDLHKAIRNHRPGDIVRLMLIREGQFMYLDYELNELDFDTYIQYYDSRKDEIEQEDIPKEPKEELPLEEEKEDESN
jgi:S1-C subfamily serine protease